MRESFIRLTPGIPDDRNLEYLPSHIKNTNIVINENGNNSIVYPKSLVKYEEEITEGKVDVWYEYVPEQLAKKSNRAMVISLHGGLMEGWGQAVYSSWVKIADREGFIVIFPNASKRKFWTIDYNRELEAQLTSQNSTGVYLNIAPKDITMNEDANMILHLMEMISQKYGISKEKIFIHGMSMGDMMASMMGRYYGYKFAGIALTGALVAPEILYDEHNIPINSGGNTDIFQTHMELDNQVAGSNEEIEIVIKKNREYWLKINQCGKVPNISIQDVNNFAYYAGEKDYIFREVKNRDHGQTMDEAEIVWDTLFSGRKLSDNIRNGDEVSIALVNESDKVFLNGSILKLLGQTFQWSKYAYHGQGGNRILRGTCIMIAVEDLCKIFHAEAIEDTKSNDVTIKLQDGRILQFAKGNIACVMDNKIKAMTIEAVEKNERLFISVEWFCRVIMNYQLSQYDDVFYITNHYAELSKNMAYLIKDLLKENE